MLSLPPLLFDDVPDFLNGIQYGAVGGQEHVAEALAIQLHHFGGLVYGQVVLHDHRRLATAQLEIDKEGNEGISSV